MIRGRVLLSSGPRPAAAPRRRPWVRILPLMLMAVLGLYAWHLASPANTTMGLEKALDAVPREIRVEGSAKQPSTVQVDARMQGTATAASASGQVATAVAKVGNASSPAFSTHAAAASVAVAAAFAATPSSDVSSPTADLSNTAGGVAADRCSQATGTWCSDYYKQAELPRPPPPRGDVDCPLNCSGVGVCNYDTGLCYCPAGYGGPSCRDPARRPCFNMGPDKRDLGWTTEDRWVHSRCSGVCDDLDGFCYCPPETKYGRIEAPPGSAPGTPPTQLGRPLHMCNPTTDAAGVPLKWGSLYTYDDLFGPQGWCNADSPTFPQTCPCRVDGRDGRWCNVSVEQTCSNQCSGRGECQLGFCKCYHGWYGSDCSRLRKGLNPAAVADQDGPKPWLKQVVAAPAAADPPAGTKRKRPFIYIYDMSTDVYTNIMAYRVDRTACNYRFFSGKVAAWTGDTYSTDPLLEESFRQSPHRTFDPEEADFFYVPTMASCFYHIVNKNSYPTFPPDSRALGTRPYGAAMLMRQAAQWVNTTFPWFRRRGGRDHIWVNAHDEGACGVTSDIWSGIHLSSWGRMDPPPHYSCTSYGSDNYSVEMLHNGESYLSVSSHAHPCYDPNKDLVIPALKRPQSYEASPFMGGTKRNRTILAFFKGDLRMHETHQCVYSRCIRQTVYNASKLGGWMNKHGILFGSYDDIPSSMGSYSELLSSSVFCFVIPGDGWSPRMEDAMLHGCIPVIIMDNVHAVFESVLDLSQFSIRVAQADVARIPDILKAIPLETVQRMQDVISRVWGRFRYNSVPHVRHESERIIKKNKQTLDNGDTAEPEMDAAPTDAFDTIIQWLHSRIPDTRS